MFFGCLSRGSSPGFGLSSSGMYLLLVGNSLSSSVYYWAYGGPFGLFSFQFCTSVPFGFMGVVFC